MENEATIPRINVNHKILSNFKKNINKLMAIEWGKETQYFKNWTIEILTRKQNINV